MKQHFKILVLLVIALCAVQNIFGQQSAEEDKTFRDLLDKSRTLRRASKTYRIRTTQKTYTDEGKALKSTVTSISEYAEPDRWYYSATTETGGKTTKFESISIGEKSYIRENDGKWSVKSTESLYGLAGVSTPTVRFIEKTTFEGQSVSVYEERLSTITESGRSSRTTRYWFTDSGRVLKEEAEEENLTTNETSRIVRIYEYDAKVKIEAPVK